LAAVPTIAVASPPDAAADAVVTAGLRAHLSPTWGHPGRTDVSAYLKNDAGEVVGGLLGYLAWGWLYIERFWVDAALRGRGHGGDLLAAVEGFAFERGCRDAHLDTFGDEALPFYAEHGYEVWGTLEGLPPGSRKLHLRKRLASAGPGDQPGRLSPT
jgi:GNAT superfamily N-acetyltransferase